MHKFYLWNNYSRLIIFACLLICFSCDDSIPDYTTISYGTSFGMCEGYCIKTMTLEDSKVQFEKASNNVSTDYPDTFCDDDFFQFKELKTAINSDDFYSIAETIGCPDCVDGGAEWMELSSSKSSHRVTFELGKHPDAIESYIETIRFYYQRMEATCP